MAKNGNANNQNIGTGSQTSSGSTTNQTTSGTTQQQPQTTVNQQISNPKYVVTIGFEVNQIDAAFKDDIQDLSVDYGHAFFYITDENNKVYLFFSFGPGGGGKFPFTYAGKRPGDTSYTISEICNLLRFDITKEQAEKVKKAADEFTDKVNKGEEKYFALGNDTCAETAYDILAEGGVNTPSAKGRVKPGMFLVNWIASLFTFKNPYMWHKRFIEQYTYPEEIVFLGPDGLSGLETDTNGDYLITLKRNSQWLLTSSSDDPLANNSDLDINGKLLQQAANDSSLGINISNPTDFTGVIHGDLKN